MAKPLIFVVSGQEQPAGAVAARGSGAPEPRPTIPRGRLKQSVRVGARRGAGGDVRVAAEPGKDIVVLRIAGGPALYLRPESAVDLLRAQSRPPGKRGVEEKEDDILAKGEIRVPGQLQWRGLESTATARSGAQGGLGDVLLEGIDVLTDAAADLTADLVIRKVDDQVTEGVYLLQRDDLPKLKETGAKPAKVAAAPRDDPVLVLVHGTFSNTSGTFAKLWKEHPQRVAALFDHYENRVYALDHRTLGASPISNALTLAQALPKHARVHLLTHSRGGLVAEVLARACASKDRAADLKFFAGQGYEQHRKDLAGLHELVTQNDIQVGQVVRVACPARGTLLASKRLDAYLSIFKWSLELAGVPVLPAIVDFLAEVATRREDPAKIPGLSAQIPNSPLVKWLHSAPDPIPGELRVVAGDLEGDSVVSWLKALVADSFYWTDNDLVVQTRSMYGGAPRDSGATFVLDQSGKVSHFNYFSNETTAAAIVNALVGGDTRKYQPIGPRSWAGEVSSGVRARAMRDSGPASDKPAVFVLPGILGSNLKVDGKRIWLGPRIVFGLKRLAFVPDSDNVRPDGPLGLYDDLSDFLSETHEVIEFGYDWRRPVEEEARRLADEVGDALAAREHSGQPVRLVAHSMGGILARTMLLERPEVWKQMMSRTGARVLMLGTPNGGSWAPMQVLSGDDTFGNFLVAIGAPFQGYEARTMMAAFPGFIQLQAGLQDAHLGLASAATWKKLAADDLATVHRNSTWHSDELQLNEYRWGVPAQQVLDQAVALRRKLDAQRDTTLGAYSDKILLVVGQSEFTPDGFDAGGREGLVYLNAKSGGDGRVTWASARLPGVQTWKVECEHGKLPEEKGAYGAYLELLEKGTTTSLGPLLEGPGTRGSAAAAESAPMHVRSRPARSGSSGRPPTADRDLLAPSGREARESARDPGKALHITVTNGDLKFVRQPLVLGHYRSVRLTGTEWVMNELIGHTMSEKVKAGSYPDAPGTHQVFTNRSIDADYPGRIPRPEAVIVAGLGGEGELRAVELVQTVRQAVIEWAQRESEKPSGASVDVRACRHADRKRRQRHLGGTVRTAHCAGRS